MNAYTGTEHVASIFAEGTSIAASSGCASTSGCDERNIQTISLHLMLTRSLDYFPFN